MLHGLLWAGLCALWGGRGVPILAFLGYEESVGFSFSGGGEKQNSRRYPSCVLLQLNLSLACFVLPQESLYERKDNLRPLSPLEMATVSKLVS